MKLDQYFYISKRTYKVRMNNLESPIYPKELNELENSVIKDCFAESVINERYQVGCLHHASMIRRWIIENCNGGNHPSGEIYISKHDLKTLLNLCAKVLQDKSKAEKLLPIETGYFGRGQDYDELYFSKLNYMLNLAAMIIKFLDENKGQHYFVVYEES